MFPDDPIDAGPLVLRLPAERDADTITRACSDPQIARFLPLVPSPYSRDDALHYLNQVVPQTWKAGGAEFAIADRATDELLGVVSVKPPDRFGNGEVGYWVAPWARGRGVATTALRALADRAFAHGMPRLVLLAAVENIASQLVACHAGFEREGLLRGAWPARDGTRGDFAAFARLATDPGDPIEPYLPFFPGGHPGGSLTDGVVLLTPLSEADVDDYHALMSAPDVVRFSATGTGPDRAESETRCRHAGHQWLAGQRAEIAVRDAATGAFAGHLQLANVIPPLGQAMVGYALDPAFRGRGLMTRAVNLLVEWAFGNTPLARIIAGTDPANTASHRVLERAGFTREALIKGLLPSPDGGRRDDVQWVRLRR